MNTYVCDLRSRLPAPDLIVYSRHAKVEGT